MKTVVQLYGSLNYPQYDSTGIYYRTPTIKSINYVKFRLSSTYFWVKCNRIILDIRDKKKIKHEDEKFSEVPKFGWMVKLKITFAITIFHFVDRQIYLDCTRPARNFISSKLLGYHFAMKVLLSLNNFDKLDKIS